MENKDTENENMDDFSARDTINKIKQGSIDPCMLTKQARLDCVEFFMLEGWLQGPIAQFLKKSDRTIRRDMDEIRSAYGKGKNAVLTHDVLSDVLSDARVHHGQLLKIARSPSSSPAERIKAEVEAWRLKFCLLQELFYMGGYTPEKVEEVPLQMPGKEEDAFYSNLVKLSGLERDVIMEKMARAVDKVKAEAAEWVQRDEDDQKAREAKAAQEAREAQKALVASVAV